MHIDKQLSSNAPQSQSDDDSEDEDKRTIFCANLSDRVTEELLCELFIQGGPVESVRIPTDKDGRQRNYGFVTYIHSCSVQYALQLFDGIRLFNRVLTLRSNNNNIERSRLPVPAPAPPSSQIFPRDSLVKQSFNNADVLRLGGTSNSHIRFDSHMQPNESSKEQSNTGSKNPFKIDLDVLSRLSSNLLPIREPNSTNSGNSNNPFSRNNQRQNDKTSRNREDRKPHPYHRSDKSKHNEKSGKSKSDSCSFNDRKRNHRGKRNGR